MNWEIIGFMASCLSAITYIPEVRKALKTYQLDDVAWGMLFCVVASSSLWFVYGINTGTSPILLSSGINVVMVSILIFIKYKCSRRKNRKIVKEEAVAEA